MKKGITTLLCLCIFFLTSFCQSKITSSNGGDTVLISGQAIYHDTNGNIISLQKFDSLLSSQEYLCSFQKGLKDTLNFYLRLKYSSDYLNKSIPPMSFKTIDGDSLVVGKSHKLIILTFWNDKCLPCIEMIDTMDSLAICYKNVDFIAFPLFDGVENFLRKHSWKYVRVPIEYNGEYSKYFPAATLVFLDQNNKLKKILWETSINEIVDFLKDSN